MAQLESRNIETSHETRKFQANGHLDVVTLGDFTMGRGTFQPGWQWSKHVKPIAQTDSCQAAHMGYCVSVIQGAARRRGAGKCDARASVDEATPGRS